MIFQELRVQTASHHERLENRLNLFQRVQSRTSYAQLLKSFYGFYSQVEPRLASLFAWTKYQFDFESRKKVPLLLQDLKFLGISEIDLDQYILLREVSTKNLPSLRNFDQAIGCLYVLEGSTLGGKIISKHFSSTLGLDLNAGLKFFSSYQDRTAEMWRGLKVAAESYLSDGSQIEEAKQDIIRGAIETFEKFEEWLCQDLESHLIQDLGQGAKVEFEARNL